MEEKDTCNVLKKLTIQTNREILRLPLNGEVCLVSYKNQSVRVERSSEKYLLYIPIEMEYAASKVLGGKPEKRNSRDFLYTISNSAVLADLFLALILPSAISDEESRAYVSIISQEYAAVICICAESWNFNIPNQFALTIMPRLTWLIDANNLNIDYSQSLIIVDLNLSINVFKTLLKILF